MDTKRIEFQYLQYGSAAELSAQDRELLAAAFEAAQKAYAPYSNFQVGAALRLRSGEVVRGNNQENASFPAGICAERTALHAAMARFPDAVVECMAIVVPSVVGERAVSPCGICRQALLEQEQRQGRQAIRLLLGHPDGPVHEIGRAGSLLPLSFDASFLKG